MGRSLRKGRDGSTKAVKVDHLVSVVVLKDVTNAADSLQVLVAIRVVIVERGGLSRIPIGQGEVDCHRKFDFASAKHILEERVLTLKLKVFEMKGSFILDKHVLSGALFQLGKCQ